MDREGFLEWVRASRWRTAKSSPHSYTIRYWHRDRERFTSAVRFADEHGEPGWFNGERFYYFRPGDGWRYWSYRKRGEGCKAEEVVAFNRARESDQLPLWSQEEWEAKQARLTWEDGDISIKRK